MKKILCCLLAAAFLTACGSTGKKPISESISLTDSDVSQYVVVPSSGTQSSPQSRQSIQLVVPEGFTLAKIGLTLEEKGVCTASDFIAATQEMDTSGYDFIAQRPADVNRCFSLEGYLFPATYEIQPGSDAGQVIQQMLNATSQRLMPELRQQIADSGYTIDQVLTLASIIEKEAFGLESMGLISSVLHNRLAAGMPLQTDVTIKYVEGAIKPFITGDIDRYNSHYNTYKCPALPAGPICNPGMAAIQAALNPTPSDYYYFLTDAQGQYHWAATLEEHNANRQATGV